MRIALVDLTHAPRCVVPWTEVDLEAQIKVDARLEGRGAMLIERVRGDVVGIPFDTWAQVELGPTGVGETKHAAPHAPWLGHDAVFAADEGPAVEMTYNVDGGFVLEGSGGYLQQWTPGIARRRKQTALLTAAAIYAMLRGFLR